MTAARDKDTVTRLLDAAERAFAAKGFEGASLREITAEAGANLAAVNYHFGSKEELFVAVVARRLAPLNELRLRMLDEAEARAGRAALEVEEILRILIEPMLGLGDGAGPGDCAMRLIGRSQDEPEELWRRIADGPLREIRKRILAAMRRALPRLPESEIALRMHFCMSAVKGVITDQHKLRVMSGGLCDPKDTATIAEGLIRFVSAGLRTPATPRARARKASRSPRS